jgi:hypothetical protein
MGPRTDMAKKKANIRWWNAPWKLFVKTLIGVFIFSVIAGAAVSLNFIIQYLEERNCDLLITWGLKAVEYALFIIDLVLFGRFLWRTAYQTWWEL